MHLCIFASWCASDKTLIISYRQIRHSTVWIYVAYPPEASMWNRVYPRWVQVEKIFMLVREFRGLRVWLWLPVVTLKFGTHFAACWIIGDVFSSESLMDHVSAVNYHMDTFLYLYSEPCCPFAVCRLVSYHLIHQNLFLPILFNKSVVFLFS